MRLSAMARVLLASPLAAFPPAAFAPAAFALGAIGLACARNKSANPPSPSPRPTVTSHPPTRSVRPGATPTPPEPELELDAEERKLRADLNMDQRSEAAGQQQARRGAGSDSRSESGRAADPLVPNALELNTTAVQRFECTPRRVGGVRGCS